MFRLSDAQLSGLSAASYERFVQKSLPFLRQTFSDTAGRESEDALISLLLRQPKRAVERASQAGAEKREEHHLAAQEGVAVLTSRLAEATAASPRRKEGSSQR